MAADARLGRAEVSHRGSRAARRSDPGALETCVAYGQAFCVVRQNTAGGQGIVAEAGLEKVLSAPLEFKEVTT